MAVQGSILFTVLLETGKVSYWSIKIKSGRKYNLLTHCSPSGVRRLTGARRIKYISKRPKRCVHTHAQAYWSAPGTAYFQSCRGGDWVSWQCFMTFSTHLHRLHHTSKTEWAMAAENNARSWLVLLFSHVWEVGHCLFVCSWGTEILRGNALFVYYKLHPSRVAEMK